jgi:hypothetical protein
MERNFKRGADTVEVDYYGHAVDAIFKKAETGRWYASNEKYITPIFYCPFCGIQLMQED